MDSERPKKTSKKVAARGTDFVHIKTYKNIQKLQKVKAEVTLKPTPAKAEDPAVSSLGNQNTNAKL